jgi:hypothetical protein
MRPVASGDAECFVVDIGDIVEAFLNLTADYLQFFWTEGQTVQKFDRHMGLTRDLGRLFQCHWAHRRGPAGVPHEIR